MSNNSTYVKQMKNMNAPIRATRSKNIKHEPTIIPEKRRMAPVTFGRGSHSNPSKGNSQFGCKICVSIQPYPMKRIVLQRVRTANSLLNVTSGATETSLVTVCILVSHENAERGHHIHFQENDESL